MPAVKKTTAAKKTGATKKGLYANIQAKHEHITHGSGEHMRQLGGKGAPLAEALEKAAHSTAAAKNGP